MPEFTNESPGRDAAGEARTSIRRERFRYAVDTTDPTAVRGMARLARALTRELRGYVNDAVASHGKRRFSRRFLRAVTFTRLRRLEAYLDALAREPPLHGEAEVPTAAEAAP